MKKFTVMLALVFLLIPLSPGAEWMSYRTVTSSGLITAGNGYYYGIRVNTDGTNAATVTVYDNTSASGAAIDPSTVYPTAAMMRMAAVGYEPPLVYQHGLYVSLSCAGTASVTVYYRPE